MRTPTVHLALCVPSMPCWVYVLSLGRQGLNLADCGLPVIPSRAQHKLSVSVLNAKYACRLLLILQNPT